MPRVLIPKSPREAHNLTEQEIHDFYQGEISSALKELLETKHLYQTVQFDDSLLMDEIQNAKVQSGDGWADLTEVESTEDQAETIKQLHAKHRDYFIKVATYIGRGLWRFRHEGSPFFLAVTTPVGKTDNTYYFPTIQIPCTNCDAVRPAHNSGYTDLHEPDIVAHDLCRGGERVVQVFSLPYQCQSCKGEPIVFLIRREGFRLTLVGRSHFESPEVPEYVPKNVRDYYRRTLISQHCNQPLAAIFYLRTLIEQHMRLTLNTTDKLTGDELAERYAKTLPENFLSNFPSLRKSYENLSLALHSVMDDEALFLREKQQIEAHFDALRVFQRHAMGKQAPAKEKP